MNRRIALIATLVLVAAVPAGVAQVPPGTAGALAAKIVQARNENTALLKQYTWNSRTELVKDGQTVGIRIDQVQYGSDGKLHRTVINNDTFSHPKGLLPARRLASRITGPLLDDAEVQKRLQELHAVLDQYTLPTAEKVQTFLTNATVENVTDPNGTPRLRLQGKDVVLPGDSLTIWADATTHKLCRVEITTTYEKQPANLTATFKTLDSGLTIMNQAEVELPEKNLMLQVHNYDYEALNG